MRRVALLLILAFAAPAFAQGAPPPPAPAPPAPAPAPGPATDAAATAPAPELAAAMKAFEGKWKCTGKAAELAPHQKAHPVAAESSTKKELNGYWYFTRYDEKKTKENPAPYLMHATVGWDAQKRQLTRTDVDGLGVVTQLSSNGWEGDKLVWSGEMVGAQTQFRETVTKKSPKELASLLEIAGADGKWATLVEMSCKKP